MYFHVSKVVHTFQHDKSNTSQTNENNMLTYRTITHQTYLQKNRKALKILRTAHLYNPPRQSAKQQVPERERNGGKNPTRRDEVLLSPWNDKTQPLRLTYAYLHFKRSSAIPSLSCTESTKLSSNLWDRIKTGRLLIDQIMFPNGWIERPRASLKEYLSVVCCR